MVMKQIGSRAASLLAAVVVTSLVACGPPAPAPTPPADEPGVVEVLAEGLTFRAPDEVPSGWTTLRLVNSSNMAHFALVSRLPEGIGVLEHQREVAPVFQQGFDLLVAGETDAAMAKFGELPEWFADVVFLGGPGLVSSGRVAEATTYLEPGLYMLECYVKTNGVFHSYSASAETYGMVHELRVTDEASGAPEPRATVRLVLSSERGIEMQGAPAAGEHVVAVRFEDQVVHENFVGHDVHLARLADGTDLDALAEWMDWSRPKGLQTPAPVVFLGGTNEMPAGTTAYFRADLEPGRYAWVAEVTDPRGKAMLVEFTVPPAP